MYLSNYHDTLTQYKKLLNSEKNDYFNAKISDLEKTTDNLDAKTFWKCLKSMDGTKKGCPINLGGKLAAIVSLHSNELLKERRSGNIDHRVARVEKSIFFIFCP